MAGLVGDRCFNMHLPGKHETACGDPSSAFIHETILFAPAQRFIPDELRYPTAWIGGDTVQPKISPFSEGCARARASVVQTTLLSRRCCPTKLVGQQAINLCGQASHMSSGSKISGRKSSIFLKASPCLVGHLLTPSTRQRSFDACDPMPAAVMQGPVV